MIYEFQERIDSAKQYYDQFKDWLSKQKGVVKVWDANLEDDLKGVDLYCQVRNGKIYKIQVKVDHWADKTGNLPFETISQAYSNRNSVIGAEFNMVEVDYIFFILSHSQRILEYKFKPLLAYVIEHYKTFKNFGAENPGYWTLGCLVPIDEVKHLLECERKLDD